MTFGIEVYRGSVATWEADEMGHMNVRFYLAKAEEGLAHLSAALGLGGAYRRQEGRGLIAKAHHNVRFQRELLPGRGITIRAGVLEMKDESLTVYQEMRPTWGAGTDEGAPNATFIVELAHVNLETRRPHPLPEETRAKAATLMMTVPAHGAPRGLAMGPVRASASLADAEALGLVEIYKGAVSPAHTGLDGFVRPSAMMGFISDGIASLIAAFNPGRRDPGTSRIGGAALEYRFIYRNTLEAGDLVTIRSGLISVGEKTQTYGHWILNAETGAAVATAEALAVSLDLDARKVVAIPPENRAAMERFLIPGFSA